MVGRCAGRCDGGSSGLQKRPEWVIWRPTRRPSSEPKAVRWALVSSLSSAASRRGSIEWRVFDWDGPAIGADGGGFTSPDSFAPLRPKLPQRRSVCSEGEPSRFASQPSMGWMHQRLAPCGRPLRGPGEGRAFFRWETLVVDWY